MYTNLPVCVAKFNSLDINVSQEFVNANAVDLKLNREKRKG